MNWTASIPADPSVPIHVRIRRGIREAVQAGSLLPGQQLPAIRALAEELGVNRLTVLKAIQSLNRSGLLKTIQGKGIFVAQNPKGLEPRAPQTPAQVGPFFEGVAEGPVDDPAGSAPDADVLKATIDYAMAEESVSFAAGFPPPEATPTDTIRLRMNRLLRSEQGHRWLGYVSTEGHPELRKELGMLLLKRGLDLNHRQGLLVTTGAQQAISLCLDALLRPGDSLAMESPGYMGVIAACRMKKIRMVPVPVDRTGLNPQRLESALRLHDVGAIYTVPNFQNPTGLTQSLHRRRQILDLAVKHNAFIIEDDIFADTRFGGRGVAPIKSLPGAERVIYVGSFSKSLAPGLRLGFLVADESLIDNLRRFKEVTDMGTGALMQGLAADLLRGGFYRRHLAKIRRLYRQRRDAMFEFLARYLAPFGRFSRPRGGMHLWIMLDRPVDAVKLLERTRERGVSFAPGNLFFCDGRRSSSFRLNFSFNPPEKIEEGVRRLAACIAEEADQ